MKLLQIAPMVCIDEPDYMAGLEVYGQSPLKKNKLYHVYDVRVAESGQRIFSLLEFGSAVGFDAELFDTPKVDSPPHMWWPDSPCLN